MTNLSSLSSRWVVIEVEDAVVIVGLRQRLSNGAGNPQHRSVHAKRDQLV